MITSETSDPDSALAALRLINKARQCAKRGDVSGMRSRTYHAHVACKGNCDTFVRHTSRLWRDVLELVGAMQGEREHGV